MSKNEISKVKQLGQVFTPSNIVEDVLNSVGYRDSNILKKHIIDNSCGEGAFLVNIVNRYIRAALKNHENITQIKRDLERYIHGIEIDKETYDKCVENLDSIANKYNLGRVRWDIKNNDAIMIDKYDNKMDYVVGNPPYVRIHNLMDRYDKVKNYHFCKGGMTDLYLLFYEIGLKMLKKTGRLAYITPNSCYNSFAGKSFRQYVKNTNYLYKIMDMGHYNPFTANTYTTIMFFDRSTKFENVEFYKYKDDGKCDFIAKINYDDLFINDNIILTKNNREIKKIMHYQPQRNIVEVKNGFATLKDDFFIKKEFPFSEHVIEITKASKGLRYKCFYPYNAKGELIDLTDIQSIDLKKYLYNNKEILEKRSLDKNTEWYAFGRSQGINDVFKNKISLSNVVKDVNSIKLNRIKSGEGVYSGLYILTGVKFDIIEKLIKSEDFINYISSLNKCKHGGYYTYSSKDVSRYLNYKLNKGECYE